MNKLNFIKKLLKIFYRKILVFIFSFIYKKPIFTKKKNNNYSVKKIRLNNIDYYSYKIIGGRIYTDNDKNTAYITKDNKLLKCSYQFKPFKNSLSSYNGNIKDNLTLTEGTPRILKKKSINILSLLSGGASRVNFSHWFLDVLPRIFLFKKIFKKEKIDKIFVPSIKYKYQLESLELLGFNLKDIISAEKIKHLKANKIFATSHPSNFRPMSVPAWNINFIRNSYIRLKKKSGPNFRKIYIERDNLDLSNNENLEKFKKHRAIVNGGEVKEFLISKGFEVIKPEKYNFRDQISIYNNAKIIFGLFGAAMYLIALCKKNTNIIEVRPKKASNEFKRISNFCKLKHHQINIKPIIDPGIYTQQGLLNCSIKDIELILRKIKE